MNRSAGAGARRWVAVAVGLLFVALIVLADVGALPAFWHGLARWPGADKLGHVVLYSLLALTVGLAVPPGPASRPGRWLAWAGGLLVLLTILEEWSQAFLPRRTASWADLACSLAGLAAGLAAAWARRRSQSRAQP